MFTGIVGAVGAVREVSRRDGSFKLVLELTGTEFLQGTTLGESIAVDGACYTVVEFGADWFAVELSPESLAHTVAASYRRGTRVNLERALRLGDRLGGHLVSGHVDAVGKITAVEPRGNSVRIALRAPREVSRYLVTKGSVTIDGVSLTVGRVDGDDFDVFIIPHTGAQTTLLAKGAGAAVNLEADLVGKYLEKLAVRRD